jgi:P27 family predicted phage terminase small subunit
MGRPAKPNAIRKLEGNREHRPLRNEANHAPGIPDKPKGISAAASAVWDRLVADMDPQILRLADRCALWHLCEDEAILAQAYSELWKATKVAKNAAGLSTNVDTDRRKLPGEILPFLSTADGRGVMTAIRDLAHRTITERREFGLTPSSRTRVGTDKKAGTGDPLDDVVFGQHAEAIRMPKPN